MHNSYYAFTLENFAQGRFDVFAENGMRVGHIIGGNGTWAAEVGNKVLGHYGNTQSCAEAILSHKGIVSIKAQMELIIARHPTMKRDAKQDFYVEDVRFIDNWHCATNLIWIVTDNCTQLHALDLPQSADDVFESLDKYCPEGCKQECQIYLVDFDKLQVTPITEHQARSMVFTSPKYQLHQDVVKLYADVLARISMRAAHELGYGNARRCHVTVECEIEPSAGSVAVLAGMVFKYVRDDESKRFAAPKTVEVRYAGKKLYEWTAEQCNS